MNPLPQVPSGPGGIVLHDSSPPPGGVEVDFSHTVNMLTLLAKADIKLKSHAAKEHAQDSRFDSFFGAMIISCPKTFPSDIFLNNILCAFERRREYERGRRRGRKRKDGLFVL